MIPSTMKDGLLSIAITVKVLTVIGNGVLGYDFAKSSEKFCTMQVLWCTQESLCPPLSPIAIIYLVEEFLNPTHLTYSPKTKEGAQLVQNTCVKRSAYIKLKGTQGTQSNRCT